MGVGLHIVADQNILQVKDFFSTFGKVSTVDGHLLKAEDLRQVDVLLVRSVTNVNAYLLSECERLKFVGTATTGTDHIDQIALSERKIIFSNAPGSNSDSVVEYVLSVLACLTESLADLKAQTIGIVGYGTIGSKLGRALQGLGCSVIANDPPLVELARHTNPPREDRIATSDGMSVSSVSIEELFEQSDIVSVHVPLVIEGRWPTKDLIDVSCAARMKAGTVFINTSRGITVTHEALNVMLGNGVKLALDVWPNEPQPEPALVERASIATPHIAGYSYDGKVLGTRMLRDALVRTLNPPRVSEQSADVQQMVNRLVVEAGSKEELFRAIRGMYDVRDDDARFREAYLGAKLEDRDQVFRDLRKNYPKRRSFDAFSIEGGSISVATQTILNTLLRVRLA